MRDTKLGNWWILTIWHQWNKSLSRNWQQKICKPQNELWGSQKEGKGKVKFTATAY